MSLPQLGNIFVYRDRAVVRDAIDSAVLSALADKDAPIVQANPTKYYEEHIVIYVDKRVVIKDYLEDRQSTLKYNMYVDQVKAEATAKKYFRHVKNNNKSLYIKYSYNFRNKVWAVFFHLLC